MLIRRVLIWSAAVFIVLFVQSNIAGAMVVTGTTMSEESTLSVRADGKVVNDGLSANFTNNISYFAGINVIREGWTLILGAADVMTDGYTSYGVVTSGERSSIIFRGTTNISTSGANSYGAYTLGAASTMTFGGITSIITSGGGASGAVVEGDRSGMTFSGTTSLVTQNVLAPGVVVSGDGSSITFDGETTLKTTGILSSGAVVSGTGSSINFNDKAAVVTDTGRSYGAVVSGDGSSINFSGETNITTSGTNAFGAYVAGTGSHVDIGGAATITTGGSIAHGAYITGTGSSVDIDGAATITTGGKGAHGAYVNAAGSTISFNDAVAITTNNDLAYGAYVNYANGNASKISFNSGAVITTSGANAHGVFTINSSAGIEFKSGAEIAVSGSGAYALYAALGSIASTQSGKYMVFGDMLTVLGTIDLEMTSGSLFTGRTSAGSGNISLTMADSRWNVTGDSNLTRLNLDSTEIDYRNAALGTTITTKVLDGPGGTLRMKTDIVNEKGDRLVITDTMYGSHHEIFVYNNGSAATTGDEIITLVDTADSTGSFQLANKVELGAWLYSLRQEDGGLGSEWQLYASKADPIDPTEPSAPIDSDGGSKTLTSAADAAINTVYAAYLLNYAEMQTLINRLGDLRESPHRNGFWFKGLGGSFESQPKQLTKPFDMDYWGVQLGYDRKLDIKGEANIYAGVMFGYSEGDLDLANGGSGDIDSKTVGVYGTYIHPNGFFADLVLKYQWMDSDFDVLDSAGTRVNGNGASSGGFGASLELGKRISFGNKQKSGWYVEPQVQMSLQRLGGGYFTASNGLHIGADNYTSLLGRIGILAGYETEKSNFSAKVSRVKEFDGDVTILANGQPIDITFDSSWWVYGLSYTSRLDDKNSIYIDLERASGGLFTQKWAIQAGWRMEF